MDKWAKNECCLKNIIGIQMLILGKKIVRDFNGDVICQILQWPVTGGSQCTASDPKNDITTKQCKKTKTNKSNNDDRNDCWWGSTL